MTAVAAAHPLDSQPIIIILIKAVTKVVSACDYRDFGEITVIKDGTFVTAYYTSIQG